MCLKKGRLFIREKQLCMRLLSEDLWRPPGRLFGLTEFLHVLAALLSGQTQSGVVHEHRSWFYLQDSIFACFNTPRGQFTWTQLCTGSRAGRFRPGYTRRYASACGRSEYFRQRPSGAVPACSLYLRPAGNYRMYGSCGQDENSTLPATSQGIGLHGVIGYRDEANEHWAHLT